MSQFTSIEICAGAGGQALGIERAGFKHQALIEINKQACATLRLNRPNWNVIEGDLKNFHAFDYKGIDLVAGGVPCPPFSKAGKQLGPNDERNLFPEAIRIVDECRPKAVMLENVRGMLDAVFEDYRNQIRNQFKKLGYKTDWHLLNASDFGVSQLRPRVVFIAFKDNIAEHFSWPVPCGKNPLSVGELLYDLMSANGWLGAKKWQEKADDIAPTIVGGSLKHGGPDLGPTRAKRAWASLGVNGHSIAEEAPAADFAGMPRLTIKMVARLQGFPDEWQISGRKTPAYRQLGNAFPPPVAEIVGFSVYKAIKAAKKFLLVSKKAS
ncbi:MAG: DNA cytosine methyltransferase [Deltaproteobacteria bacterium]|nr:DNA cytosine methyltransferase [Deltaproteobacteria bacterium]